MTDAEIDAMMVRLAELEPEQDLTQQQAETLVHGLLVEMHAEIQNRFDHIRAAFPEVTMVGEVRMSVQRRVPIEWADSPIIPPCHPSRPVVDS